MYVEGMTHKQISEHFQLDSKKGSEVVRERLLKAGVSSRVGKAEGSANSFFVHGIYAQKESSRDRYNCYRKVLRFLGMPLPAGWIVHHIDTDPTNNNLSNLCLFPTAKIHANFHLWLISSGVQADSTDAIHRALEIGGSLLLPLPDRNATEPETGLLDLLRTESKRLGIRTKWQHLASPEYRLRERQTA
jgi:hypothetical protein